jgi:hypothetical protein
MKNLLTICVAVALSSSAHGAVLVPIVDVFGHNEGTNFGGEIDDMINGSGMNGNDATGSPTWPAGQGTPDTWTWTGVSTTYQAEWQSRALLQPADSPTNGKIGWTILDLGSSTVGLADLYVFHVRETGTRVATDFNVYVAASPTVPVTSGPTSGAADYDFASGGWSLVEANFTGGTQSGTSTISLDNTTGRYIGIEILANGGDATRVGFQEIGVTAIPEPGALMLGSISLLGLLRRQRKS